MSLSGRTILLTRTAPASDSLRRLLEGKGATVTIIPGISITPPDSWEECDGVLGRIDRFSVVAFTSAHAVASFMMRTRDRGIGNDVLSRIRMFAVGESTAAALAGWGMDGSVPAEHSGRGLVRLMLDSLPAGQQVLLPRGDIARDDLPAGLRAGGHEVTSLVVYRTVPPPTGELRRFEHCMESDPPWATLFASPSAARHLVGALDPQRRQAGLPCLVAAIGKTTAIELAGLGIRVDVIARTPDPQAIVRVLEEACMSQADSHPRNSGAPSQ